MNSKAAKIRRHAVARGVTSLYHFSPVGNTGSILTNGLLSRSILDANEVGYLATDQMRLDGQVDAVSLSIHSINEAMFLRKKKELRTEWIVYELSSSILWTHECRFCATNAASAEVSSHRGYLGGLWGFSQMFDDRPVNATDGRSFRDMAQRAKCQPTNNDAEVQVLQPISPELITALIVRTADIKDQLEAFMRGIGKSKPIEVIDEAAPIEFRRP